MIYHTNCTQCDAAIEVAFEYEPPEAQTWDEPGYPATCVINEVRGCECVQDEDALQEVLLERVAAAAEEYDEER